MNPFKNVKLKPLLPAKNHVKEHLTKYAPGELLNEIKKMSPEKREEILKLLLMDKQQQQKFMRQRDSEDLVMQQDYKKQLSQEKSRQPLKYYEDYDIEDGN